MDGPGQGQCLAGVNISVCSASDGAFVFFTVHLSIQIFLWHSCWVPLLDWEAQLAWSTRLHPLTDSKWPFCSDSVHKAFAAFLYTLLNQFHFRYKYVFKFGICNIILYNWKLDTDKQDQIAEPLSFFFFADWQANTIVTLRPASEVGVKTLRLTRRNKKCAMSVNNTPPHTCCHNVLRVWRVLIMKPTEGKISLWDSLRIYKCSHLSVIITLKKWRGFKKSTVFGGYSKMFGNSNRRYPGEVIKKVYEVIWFMFMNWVLPLDN